MKIDVNHVALLARLGLNDKEKELFGRQLSDILGYAEKIQQIDTMDTEPTYHAIPVKNVMREDVAVEFDDTPSLMYNGPEVEDNMFSVPRILE